MTASSHPEGRTPTVFHAPRCPYCARVRIVLGEKGVSYDAVEVDLDHRPRWLYDLNPSGKVPVLREAQWVLYESAVIFEYLEEIFPTPALLPDDARQRAEIRLLIAEHGSRIADDYYAFRRGGDAEPLHERLDALARVVAGQDYLASCGYSLADIAYFPWVLRADRFLDVRLPDPVEAWIDRLATREPIAREVEVVAGIARKASRAA